MNNPKPNPDAKMPDNVTSTLDWAEEYLGYCVRQGVLDLEDVENLTNVETIRLAEHMEYKSQMAYEQWKEDHAQ